MHRWFVYLTGVLSLGCNLAEGGKNACNLVSDCLDGFVCEQKTCVDPATQNPGVGADIEPDADLLVGDDTLLVRSRTAYVFKEMYIAPPNTSRYGGNLFGESVLATGGNIEIPNFLCGVYDVLLLDGIQRNCELFEQNLCEDIPRWIITDSLMTKCRKSASVQNDSNATIRELYVAKPGGTEWGVNLLGGSTLAEEELRIFPSVRCGTYDVLLVSVENSQCIEREVELCSYDRPWVFTGTACGFF